MSGHPSSVVATLVPSAGGLVRSRRRAPATTPLCVAILGCLATLAVSDGPALAAGKRTAYPEVKVAMPPPFKGDAAFDAVRRALATAVRSRSKDDLVKLVGPMFVWTFQRDISSDFDMGVSPVDNFKVVFGFRPPGAGRDGPVEGGPYWPQLDVLSDETTFFKVPDLPNLVCGPIAAGVVDSQVFEEAARLVDTPEDPVTWYFTLGDTVVTDRPAANAAEVARIGAMALPGLATVPPQQADRPVKPTHIEVLLPSGKSGFVAASAVRPLVSNRLCYAKTPTGEWKIVYFDQNE
jgi:hypothetical protein